MQRDRSGAVHVTRPKSRAGARTIAVPAPVVGEMRAHLELVGDYGRAWSSPPTRADGMRSFHAEAFVRQWRKALASVDGLPPGLVFHDLSHTGSTLAAGTGATTRELMAWMGHASPRAALIYQQASAERDRAIAEALAVQVSRRKASAAAPS
ncbi:MAG TPA: hypothetical protein VFN61_14360 [Acidimicrobiales bacterium]|nr:hypothetical protein [Acidimicrobiales bacterium]